MLVRMRAATGIVRSQAILQVRSITDVGLRLVGQTAQQVDVVHGQDGPGFAFSFAGHHSSHESDAATIL